MEVAKRHAFSSSSLINGPNYHEIMNSINFALHLSDGFGRQLHEPGQLLVGFVFSIVWQLVEASLDDEGLLELTGEKKSWWLAGPQDMEIHESGGFLGRRISAMRKGNPIMAVELIVEFLQHKVISSIVHLASKNMAAEWDRFFQQVQLLAACSTALRISKNATPEALLRGTSYTCKLLCRENKHSYQHEFQKVKSSGVLISSSGECHGTSRAASWLPIDLFLVDNMDGSQQVAASTAVENFTGLVKTLQAVNGTTWHDTFLGLWISALRLVERERDSNEGPVPCMDTSLCMLLSIRRLQWLILSRKKQVSLSRKTKLKAALLIIRKKKGPRERLKGLITALQSLAD